MGRKSTGDMENPVPRAGEKKMSGKKLNDGSTYAPLPEKISSRADGAEKKKPPHQASPLAGDPPPLRTGSPRSSLAQTHVSFSKPAEGWDGEREKKRELRGRWGRGRLNG